MVAAKDRLKRKLKKLTSRKRSGKFEEIVKRINQTTVGWVNYYGIAFMKGFMREIQAWLNHRIRQLIWKRWKIPKTKYRKLRQYGISHDEAKAVAYSRKGYWRISSCYTLHRAIPTKRLIKWGLKDMNQLYEARYLKG